MVPLDDPGHILARRLRSFRSEHWPDLPITQPMVGEALGVKVPSVSSWESERNPALPPTKRLDDYARLFATRRSHHAGRLRLLTDLSQDERAHYDRLRTELLSLRAAALGHVNSGGVTVPDPFGDNPWRFHDGKPVTLICAQLPAEMRDRMPYAKPDDPDFIELYTYADLDALFELHGHIRAANPQSEVRLRVAQRLVSDDYTSHLVLLGGIDWNLVTRNVLARIALPIEQVADWEGDDGQYFEIGGERHFPRVEDGELQEDVALFYRGPNPYNHKRTVSICNAMYGRGVLGAVRALTDKNFRDRNAEFLRDRFGEEKAFGVLTRVPIENGIVVTPDWTEEETRLHEWPPAHP
ncbi:helix-turn-helix domain-containing protein [Nonomuraea sp. NPDC050556]|uniref:helix-turn-helix domain-containing protein n=1 Tax=Nonomuraea sp. NPDC050556 TaxID=3364369 RepID=UPI003787F06F